MAYKFHTSEQRSELMKKIKSNNTAPEVLFRKALRAAGLRLRKNDKSLPGKPDIVIPKYKVAIFIDGEFWHGFEWQKKKKKIKAHRDYWIPKIERNIARDKKNSLLLKKDGWVVIRFWEADIKKASEKCFRKVLKAISKKRVPI